MTPRSRLGDRREHLRFEVFGQLWGALDRCDHVTVRNISSAGVLIEATLPSGLRSMRAAQISIGEEGPHLNAVVRHISPVIENGDRFLVGLEFVHVSSAVRDDLNRLVRDWDQRPGG